MMSREIKTVIGSSMNPRPKKHSSAPCNAPVKTLKLVPVRNQHTLFTKLALIPNFFRMTEMPEIASDGVKMNFGHKEFVPRNKIEVCRTFRGCFSGRYVQKTAVFNIASVFGLRWS